MIIVHCSCDSMVTLRCISTISKSRHKTWWMICEVDIRSVFEIGVVLAKHKSFYTVLSGFQTLSKKRKLFRKMGVDWAGAVAACLPPERAPAASSRWHLAAGINWPATTCHKQSKTPGCWYWHIVVNKLHLLENTCDPQILAFPRFNQLRH